jgi:5-methylcytosine-specific restriction enzyme subunit McrC
MRTLHLSERAGKVVRLPLADLEYLLGRHENHVEITPTGRRGRYQLTPRGVAGVIVAPETRIVIRPKIPLRNLWLLLEPGCPLDDMADRVTPRASAGMVDVLAYRLAQEMGARARAGLHRGYREVHASGPYLQGRLDVGEHLRRGHLHREQLHSIHDNFTQDVPCNQLPRTLADRLIASPVIGEETRAALLHALEFFAGVAPDSGVLRSPRVEAPASYDRLLDLCRLILEGLALNDTAGSTPAPAFLLEMERLFERYLTRGLIRVLSGEPDVEIGVQPSHVVSEPAAGQPDLVMRPDLLVRRRGHPSLIVDAKWKRLSGSPLVTEDVYQMLAYTAGLGVPRAVLVYPGKRDRRWAYALRADSRTIEIRTLRVTGTPEQCERSMYRLARSVLR